MICFLTRNQSLCFIPLFLLQNAIFIIVRVTVYTPFLSWLFLPDVFCILLTPGRGGEHAYWPSDTNLIDRSSVNGYTLTQKHTYTVLLLD